MIEREANGYGGSGERGRWGGGLEGTETGTEKYNDS